jgi:hypothetical protein
MRTFILSLLVGSMCLIWQDVTCAQNVIADYVRNVPRQYGPRDPWEVGLVMRHQAGWGGHFYNCDCEEHKRLSPYIRWEQQPTVCCPHGHCWWIKQQVNEVRQRVRTGACLQSHFCICPRCRSSEPPITPTCPSELGGPGCSSCTENAPAPTAASENWLGSLYQEK